MGRVPNWSALPSEMLSEIAGRLKMAEDFVAFRAICTTWRAAATKDIFAGVSKVPLLMLAKKDDGSNERQLYSFGSNRIVMTISLPEVEIKRCTGAGFGWLLIQTVAEEVSLWNPVSRAQIHLPSLADFPAYVFEDFRFVLQPPCISKAALSTNPSDDPSNFTILITVHYLMLCWWKVGYETWTKKDSDYLDDEFASTAFYSGKFYVLKWGGDLIVWDPSREDDFNILMNIHFRCSDVKPYLVESCDGKLLLLQRKFCDVYKDIEEFQTIYFSVIKIDVVYREWEWIDNLENCALFAGDNVVICIQASSAFPDLIKPNSIYFSEDSNRSRNVPKDMGVYSLGEGEESFSQRLKRFNVESPNFVSSPIWIDSSIVTKSESPRI